jgi:hypothetical protein
MQVGSPDPVMVDLRSRPHRQRRPSVVGSGTSVGGFDSVVMGPPSEQQDISACGV